ncbi:sugar transferase [Flavobacterium aurantiibacter]|uniref:LPS biosynthesis sugar transferase n=1 Tax=Flavobacterium aurantiibacter TaxID=2023067 RepID=A0A255ZT93_9FLAO|nr:sugar transferase [Flavobacterium aurantiibacter]OYQ43940.1 LPS biosynthesis sugar transferase [Flavobacterium aurantiibacter]
MSKRIFDISFAFLALILLMPILLVAYLMCCADTRASGLFFQERIGLHGKTFRIIKFRSINPRTMNISTFGSFMRSSKIDELPQFINILIGEMSFVGPRPDLPGYYDLLRGNDRAVLLLKPGLTSEASIKYRNESVMLAKQADPLKYNDEVIFPDKVRMNLEYLRTSNVCYDVVIIIATVVPFFRKYLKNQV